MTIRLRTLIAIGATVSLSDYQEVFPATTGHNPFSPYTFCALQCLSQVCQWANDFNRHEPIAYVLEAGAGYNQELHILMNDISESKARQERFRFHSLSIADKRTTAPLQAADVLAYEVYKDMKHRIVPNTKEKDMRRSALALIEERPRYIGHYTKEHLLSPTIYVAPDGS
jgi:hypothetical protein